jgi:hypothetical protein
LAKETDMASKHFEKLIMGATFYCDVGNNTADVWGPLNICLRVRGDGETYSNLRTDVDGEAVELYHHLLDFAVQGALLAHRGDGMAFENPDVIGAHFHKLLELNKVPLREVAEKNRSYPEGTCATHDYCDSNMVMLEAMQDLTGWTDDYIIQDQHAIALWNKSWAAFAKRLQLLHPEAK